MFSTDWSEEETDGVLLSFLSFSVRAEYRKNIRSTHLNDGLLWIFPFFQYKQWIQKNRDTKHKSDNIRHNKIFYNCKKLKANKKRTEDKKNERKQIFHVAKLKEEWWKVSLLMKYL